MATATTMPPPEKNELGTAVWDDKRSWHWPGVYYAPGDARLIVPKRPVRIFGYELELGWTLNFADVRSVPTLIAMVALPLLALNLVPRRRNRQP